MDANGETITNISQKGVAKLINQGVISEGMLPKVQCALDAVSSGVTSVQIIDGRIPHALILEVFTATGVGTQIASNAE